MIAKGNQRGGGGQLAAHLMNAHDNERVEIAETRGSLAEDLAGAFSEWRADSKITACEKYLYSLSINPDQRQGHLTREQYFEFLARTEECLGLAGQPRVVVFHEKRDKDNVLRQHCHAVWSRIDTKKARAVQISHDRMKLRSVAKEFANDHGLALPVGLQADRGAARYAARAGHTDLKENQQEERSGLPKEDRRATITAAWQQSTDGPDFVKALQNSGYVLARGDKRAYVVIDRAGEIHSLPRQIEGVKSAAVKDRLESSHPLDGLPTVEAAKEQIAAQRESLRALHERQTEIPQVKPVEEASAAPTPDERRAVLQAAQVERRQSLSQAREAMQRRQGSERLELAALQNAMHGLGRVRGLSSMVQWITTRLQQRQQGVTLARHHKAQDRELVRQERALDRLDNRERRSLETRLKREAFQQVAGASKAREAMMTRVQGSSMEIGQQEKNVMPKISPEYRRSRLQAVFDRPADGLTAQGPMRQPANGPDALRDRFSRSFPPSPDKDAGQEAERQAERQSELERLRQLQIPREP